MQFLTYVSILRRWFWLIGLSLLLAGGSAFIFTKAQPPIYEAATTLEIGSARAGNPNLDSPTVTLPRELADTYIFIVRTRNTLNVVIDRLHLNLTADALDKMFQVKTRANTALFTITVSNSNPVLAASIANALADELIVNSPTKIAIEQQDQIRVVKDELDKTQAQLKGLHDELNQVTEALANSPTDAAALTTRRSELNDRIFAAQTILNDQLGILIKLQDANAVNTLTVVEAAYTPVKSTGPSATLNTLVALVAGLVFSMSIVFVVEYLTDGIRLPSEIESLLGLSLIGMITPFGRRRAYNKKLIAYLNPISAVSEAYRILYLNLLLQRKKSDQLHLRYTVTSPHPKEGKSINAANLAVTFALTGLRVLLVDTNLRHPTLHKIFKLSNEQGLSTVLTLNLEETALTTVSRQPEAQGVKQLEAPHTNGSMTTRLLPPLPTEAYEDGLQDTNRWSELMERLAKPTEITCLSVITAGVAVPDRTGLIDSPEMRQFMENLAKDTSYDVIIFDAPALLEQADAALIAKLTTSEVILVIDAGHTPRAAAVRAQRYLSGLSLPVTGVLLNRVDPWTVQVGYVKSAEQAKVSEPVTAAPDMLPANVVPSGHQNELSAESSTLTRTDEAALAAEILARKATSNRMKATGSSDSKRQALNNSTQVIEGLSIVVFVNNSGMPLTYTVGSQITLGRHNPEANPDEHIDLTDFQADSFGVSRIHARLQHNPDGLQIEDLRSTNGTFINGVAIKPNEPYPLKSGDEIRLANVPIRIYFI